jgi:hypothetical protein
MGHHLGIGIGTGGAGAAVASRILSMLHSLKKRLVAVK